MAYDNLSVNSHQIKKFKIIQNAKIIIVFFVVASIGVGAWFAYDYYQKAVSELNGTSQDESISSTGPITGSVENDNGDVISLDDSNPVQPISPSSTPDGTSSVGGSNPSTPPSSPSSPGSTAPAPAAPSGVVTAINSIESSGIKGSAYVSPTLDTSQLPNGTTIVFDRSSWVGLSAETGSIKATASVAGQTLNTNITFGLSGGSWKAIGYSLN
jgi:cytoskeletal protein RodZ